MATPKSKDAQAQTKINPVQVQKYLKGVDYPVFREQLITKAKDNGADDLIMSTLERIPDQEYHGPNAVTHEIAQAKGQFSGNADSHDAKASSKGSEK